MVPKRSQFCPKVPNFAFVVSFRAKSQIPNPVSERLTPAKLWRHWEIHNLTVHPRDFPRLCENLLPVGDGFPNTSGVLVKHGHIPYYKVGYI